ncbi:MAG: ACP S-malonyltransferase [Endomicrobium sp.]|nr:ACP S-malonyltransferase [Endomicrobium sp.]
MKKIALIFPGQGTQYIGMGKDIYNKYTKARKIIDSAGSDLSKIIFEGEEKTLQLTKYAQPAIFTVSVAIFEVFRELFNMHDVEFIAAGHSVGEYSALYAAGFFNFKDGLDMVRSRGEFIQKASENNPGTMVAIIGISDVSKIEYICKKVSYFGICEIANFNSREQIVISGNIEAINKAVELAKELGALKTIFLNVSGPFHSSLMSSAAYNMSQKLKKYNFSVPFFGVYTNYDALCTFDRFSIKEKLALQIKSPVKWSESINNIINSGFDKFIEIGSGRVLTGLLKKIDRSKKTFNITDSISLKKTLEDINK